MKLTILVPEGENNLSSIVGSYKLFTRANAYWKQRGRKPKFDIQLAGVSRKVEFYDGLFNVKPHTSIASVHRTDLVIIPALNHNFAQAVKKNRAMIAWLETQYKLGAEIASICTGAFLLAATGLLNGRHCSTHWAAADAFRQLYPEVTLQPDKVITDEHGIYTNGGAYSFLNLLLYLIEKYYDRQTAIYCAKVFQVDIERESQSVFTIFTGQKMHSDEMVKKAQAYIEHRLDERITVEALSAKFATTRRNFDRRFIKATGNTPLEYVQRAKIELAKKSLENTRKTVSEVMYESGYSDVKAFREVFRKFTGVSPMVYRTRYNKDAMV